jgi:hypothetical protein
MKPGVASHLGLPKNQLWDSTIGDLSLMPHCKPALGDSFLLPVSASRTLPPGRPP